MNNLVFIEEAYPQGGFFNSDIVPIDKNTPCRMYINSKSILAIIPWNTTVIPSDKINHALNHHHDCYLLLVEGYYNPYDKRQNVEKYEITVKQFQKIFLQKPER